MWKAGVITIRPPRHCCCRNDFLVYTISRYAFFIDSCHILLNIGIYKIYTWKYIQILICIIECKKKIDLYIVWFNQWYQWIFYQFFFELVFWQDKSIWSTFTGYFSCFFPIKFTLWYKIQKIDFEFVFWQVKSNKFICICVLTGKIQEIDLNLYFHL